MTARSCIDCGEISDQTRCEEHRALVDRKGSATSRGYGYAWETLSKRARKAQPWCSDCGSTKDLTCDHSPEAWASVAAKRSIRLKDVDVLCRGCNARRGRARPAVNTQGGIP